MSWYALTTGCLAFSFFFCSCFCSTIAQPLQLLTNKHIGFDEGKQYACQILGLPSEIAPEQVSRKNRRKILVFNYKIVHWVEQQKSSPKKHLKLSFLQSISVFSLHMQAHVLPLDLFGDCMKEWWKRRLFEWVKIFELNKWRLKIQHIQQSNIPVDPKNWSDPFQIEQKLVYREERKQGTAGCEWSNHFIAAATPTWLVIIIDCYGSCSFFATAGCWCFLL